jgi:hypothetical protein
MVQGRHDQVAPASCAEHYAELLTAPSKQFVWFEHSAHMPQLDEPGRFRELLAKVRLGLPAVLLVLPHEECAVTTTSEIGLVDDGQVASDVLLLGAAGNSGRLIAARGLLASCSAPLLSPMPPARR